MRLVFLPILVALSLSQLRAEDPAIADPAQAAAREAKLIRDVRQVTFGGLRAGEGYFSPDGRQMVFQSEREPGNPFFQIYLMDLENGDLRRVSPGTGKTTCAWIHPEGRRILFASTHHDAASAEHQQEELRLREAGQQRRYAWDYDPEFELYVHDLNSGQNQRLTEARGYDAEASFSPDGKAILFASNRQAYERELSEREQTLFDIDPASMIEIYKMNADGTGVTRLTHHLGYDGGPFFSPDGKHFCWRRFSEDGAQAEIFTMSIDGGTEKQLTRLGAMSWAPFYHPSGEYLIFTTNRHGFANFELYIVRADGEGEPVRVTFTDGFDGLPVFLPDGQRISWTATRTAAQRSQIFIGQWDHAEARRQLGLGDSAAEASGGAAAAEVDTAADRKAAIEAAAVATPDYSPADILRHVDYLTRPELGGRLTGTEGERRATAYVAAYLESLGFEPAGVEGSWFQPFEFPAGAELAAGNRLTLRDAPPFELDKHWRPLSFSGDGAFAAAPVVFAGYGLVAPAGEQVEAYDSYVHLDVQDKWVMVLRDLPQEISPEARQHLARYAAPRRKASVARDLGARGILFVTGPTSKVRNELMPFDRDAAQAGVSMAVVSIDNATAEKLLSSSGKSLAALQRSLDGGEPAMGFELEGASLAAEINITRNTGTGRNVLARLRTSKPPTDEAAGAAQDAAGRPLVIVGAHIDHLGVGGGASSLARDDERDQIHVGADDNASGVAVMLEIAQALAHQRDRGELDAERDLLIAAWSGEELGLFGSQAFVKAFDELYPDAPRTPNPFGDVDNDPDARRIAAAHGMDPEAQPLTAAITAYLNLDMVGRLREKLVIQGIGSSPQWSDEVQRRNVPVGLPVQLDKTATRLPTDAAAFVTREVPILSAFTGAHEDYHTPRDTPEKLNYEGAAKIAHLFALITRGLLTTDQPPVFELDEAAQSGEMPRANLSAYLGTIPDYVAGEIKGMKLSGVAGDGPAAAAGLRGGDVIVELAGRKIENIYDYTYAIEALKIGEPVKIVVVRDGQRVELEVTPGSRQ